MDGSQNTVEEVTRDRGLGQVKGDRTGMADDTCADLDEPRL